MATGSRSGGATSRGFTMIEALVAVALIALLATMAYWAFDDVVPGFRLSTTASDVMNELVRTRARAISQNRNYIVHFQTGSFRVVWDQNANGAIDVGEPQTTTVYRLGVTYFRPTVDPLPNVGPAADAVVFSPQGLATNMPPGGLRIGLQGSTGAMREVLVRYSGQVKKL